MPGKNIQNPKNSLTGRFSRGNIPPQNKEERRIRSHPQRSERVNKRKEWLFTVALRVGTGAKFASVFLCVNPFLGVLRY